MYRFKILSLVSVLMFVLLPPATASFAEEVPPNPGSETSVNGIPEIDQRVPMTIDSGSASFGSGVTLKANAWIQPLANWSGCGQFRTSVVMNRSPRWIRNSTTFYQIGLGSLNIKGVSIGSSRAGANTLVWTNSNGAKGSYLSGSVCGGWGAVYLGVDVTGAALYNGATRVVSAHI